MTYRAMQTHTLGAPLALQTITPTPLKEEEARIEIRACSVNFADTLIVQGKYQEKPELPFAPGMEVVGDIIALSSQNKDFAVGDRVLAYVGFGGMADLMNVPLANCVKLPASADPVTYTAVPIAYSTSHLALFHRANLKEGETLVVLGASGGVGLTAVELGVMAGANVIACARGAQKLEVAASKGAHHLIDTGAEDLKERIRALGGADVVYDPVGGDLFHAALRACKPEARVLPLGFASGDIPQIPANIILVKNISVLGIYWGGYRVFAPQVMNDSIAQIVDWTGSGKITPHVSHVLPLEEANAALDLLKTRKATGKVVVDMAL